jgi:hypothetical protein
LGGLYLGGLYSGGLIFGEGGSYIWNEVSVSICGGLIFGGGGLIVGGLRYVKYVIFRNGLAIIYVCVCGKSSKIK